MKKVGIIHSVKAVCNFFDLLVKKQMEEVAFYNLLDDWLSNKLQESGEITPEIRSRFVADIRHQQELGVDAVLCTCSSLSKIIPQIRSDFMVPILSIDENMIDKISNREGKALVVATSLSAIAPVEQAILMQADKKKKNIILTHIFLEKAGQIMHRGSEMKDHDNIIIKSMENINDDYDFIVFAQASLAHLRSKVEEITKKQVFAGPDYCIAELKEVLYHE